MTLRRVPDPDQAPQAGQTGQIGQSGQTREPLDTPVLMLVFNRADTTARVFEAVRRARPRRLFIAADGPREHVATDAQGCRDTRAIIDAVDWDCEVHTLLRKRNLGCKVAVSSGITWFFQHVEEGIILEDDTLPVAGFFPFCQALLEHYRDDPRVMHIGGNNFQLGARHGNGSYYFSLFNHIWGWATWRRAWNTYDPSLHAFGRLRRNGVLERLFSDGGSRAYWARQFERTAAGQINTWDYSWTMSVWNNGGLAILPEVNMVSNIGFGREATHTTGDSRLALLPVEEPRPLCHPDGMEPCAAADGFTQRYIFDRRIENPDSLALDVAAALEGGNPAEGAALARRFLVLYPEDETLNWLEILAWHLAGDTVRTLGLLKPFLRRRPEHDGARRLLAAIGGVAGGGG